ncbi:MAG: hypothetical protein ACRDRJ_36555, partial [Streptosporangiaceae bacterium]
AEGSAPRGSAPVGSRPARAIPARIASSRAPVCRDAAAIRGLTIARSRFYLPENERFGLAGVIAIRRPALARAIVRDVCGLPVMPRRTVRCAADNDVTYWLMFAAGHRAYPPVVIRPTGCEAVQGLGATRWIVPVPRFWYRLGSALARAYPGLAASGHLGRAEFSGAR